MKRIICLLILCFNIIYTSAQTSSFEKYVGGYGSFEITDALEHNNNYYLLCNQSFDTFDQQSSFLLKINKDGDTVIYYNINIPYHFVLRAFIKSLNGGLCFVGGIDSLNTNFNLSRDGIYINTDFEGNINSMTSYRLSVKNELNNILADDSCYYVVGNSYSSNNNIDIQALKIDSNGKINDSLNLDFRNLDAVTSISKIDNNLLISGTILGGYNDGYLSLINKELDTLYFKKYNLFNDLNNRDIILWYSYSSKVSSNNTILFPCVFFVRNPIDLNDWTAYEHSGLLRTDINGNFRSIHIYYLNSRYDRPIDIFETNDGNYIIAGTINFAPTRPISQNINGDFYLMKVDTMGNTIWFKQYGDLNYQELKSVIQTTDGGYLLSGYSISNYTIQERIGYIVKTDSNGNLLVGLNQDKKNTNAFIYPNPATSQISIESNINFNKYTIINLFGQIIQSNSLIENIIDVANLSKGIYIIKLESESEFVNVKFVKE